MTKPVFAHEVNTESNFCIRFHAAAEDTFWNKSRIITVIHQSYKAVIKLLIYSFVFEFFHISLWPGVKEKKDT